MAVGGERRALRVLVVCTGNLYRSPVAAALLERELGNLGLPATVLSAGTDAINGLPVPRPMMKATGAMLVDLTAHRAMRLQPDQIEDADLVVAMAREHLRAVVGAVRSSFANTFTLRELARRAERVGQVTTWEDWLAAMNEGRRPDQLLGDGADDDVEDPQGKSLKVHRRVALEIEHLVWQVGDRWPVAASVGAR